MRYLVPIVCLVLGAAGGWLAARHYAPAPATQADTPSEWVARIGDDYVTADMVSAEMLRRGGHQPGLFQDTAQKRALLDDMLLHVALVDAARRDGIDRQADTRRSIEQLLTSQFLQNTLRKRQAEVTIGDAEVEAYYAQNADAYAVPARRRVAMIRVGVPTGADEATWARAEARVAEALEKARAAPDASVHFGVVAREYSDDQATRYRGGVIGWLTEGRAGQYRYDAAMLGAAFALKNAGDYSSVIRGADGVYAARLVELQAVQRRELDQLRAGIQQRLTQDRYQDIEQTFREDLLEAASIDVREAALAAIVPPGPPATDSVPQPPAMPGEQETQP